MRNYFQSKMTPRKEIVEVDESQIVKIELVDYTLSY